MGDDDDLIGDDIGCLTGDNIGDDIDCLIGDGGNIIGDVSESSSSISLRTLVLSTTEDSLLLS